MMKNNTHTITRWIHWLMATLIITIIIMGYYMRIVHDLFYYPIHKSLGVIAFIFIFIRLYVRVTNPWKSSASGTENEKLVHIVHCTLLALLLLMPISGMLNSGFGGYGIAIFGFEIIPKSLDINGGYVPFNGDVSAVSKLIHEYLGYLFSGLIVMHVIAALKHHYWNKDETLNRMLNRSS